MLSTTRAGLLVLALATASLAACDSSGEGEPTPVPLSLRADSIWLRWSAGECVGYCQGTTELGAALEATYTESPWTPDAAYPPKVESLTVAPADWKAIQSLARTALGERWQPSYGCPDCGDWGAWGLSIRTGAGEIRETTLDNRRSENPAALENLLEAIHALTPDKPLSALDED